MISLTSSLRGHRGKLLWYVALLVLSIFVFCYSTIATAWIGVPVIAAVSIIFITIGLVRLTERSHENFAQFISNISHNDFSTTSISHSAEGSALQFVEAQRTLVEKFQN